MQVCSFAPCSEIVAIRALVLRLSQTVSQLLLNSNAYGTGNKNSASCRLKPPVNISDPTSIVLCDRMQGWKLGRSLPASSAQAAPADHSRAGDVLKRLVAAANTSTVSPAACRQTRYTADGHR